MSRGARVALVIAAVAAVVVAFVILRPGSKSERNPAATTNSTVSPVTTSAPKPRPPVPTVRVRGGKPVGGVRKIEVDEGDRIRFRVTADQAELVHLHGYDIEKEVGPGNPASFNVKATITGRFEAELENSAVQVAEVTVQP